tara:strand:- start:183 stop:560 length:378 start_codon:yes stop_codon:yes gene_type:complete
MSMPQEDMMLEDMMPQEMQAPMPQDMMPQEMQTPMPQDMMPQDPMAEMPQEARDAVMRPSEELALVLMARLSNMAPEELQMLDTVITPEVARVLVRLLPELAEIINSIEGTPAEMQEQIGALSSM